MSSARPHKPPPQSPARGDIQPPPNPEEWETPTASPCCQFVQILLALANLQPPPSPLTGQTAARQRDRPWGFASCQQRLALIAPRVPERHFRSYFLCRYSAHPPLPMALPQEVPTAKRRLFLQNRVRSAFCSQSLCNLRVPFDFDLKEIKTLARVSQAARFPSMENCPKLCPSVMFWFRAASEPTAIAAAVEKPEPNKPAWGTPSTLTCSLPALHSIVFSTFGSTGFCFFFLSDFLILTFRAADTGIKGVTWAPLCQLRDPAHLQQQTLFWNSQHHPDTTWTPPGYHLDVIQTPYGHQPAMKLIGMKTCIWDWAPNPERSTQICFAQAAH